MDWAFPQRPFPDAAALGVDIETSGLNFRTDSLLLVQVSDGTDVVTVDTAQHYRLELIGDWLREQVYDRRVTMHNAQFDAPWLDYHTGCGFPADLWDTMTCEQMLTAGLLTAKGNRDESARIPLKDLALKYLGLTLDKSLQISFVGHAGALTEEQLAYAGEDARVLVPIARTQWGEVVRRDLETTWEIERQAAPVFAHMLRHGVCLDVDYLRSVIGDAEHQDGTAFGKMEATRERLEAGLTYYVLLHRQARFDEKQFERDEYEALLEEETARLELLWAQHHDDLARVDPDLWHASKWDDLTVDAKADRPKGQKRFVKAQLKGWRAEHPRPPKPRLVDEPIDLNSADQLKAALGALLKTEVENVRAATIKHLLTKTEDPEARRLLADLLDYKKVAKLVQAFGEPLIAKVYDGRVYPEFNPYGTATGRPSCNNPNLLQVPSHGEWGEQIRHAFKPAAGNVFVVCDYKAMEMRILAQMSGDPGLGDMFAHREDPHTASARLMLGRQEITKDERFMAKTAGFLACYGGGAGTLMSACAKNGTDITFEEARAFVNLWRRQFRKAWGWIEGQQSAALTHGFTKTALGRKRFFDREAEGANVGAIQRAGGNHPIQGGNADVTKIAMYLIQTLLAPYGGRVVANVYDEVVAEVPDAYAALGAEIVRESMLEAARTLLRDVPAEVDCVIASSWSEDDEVPEFAEEEEAA